jgi:LysM repeat protein
MATKKSAKKSATNAANQTAKKAVKKSAKKAAKKTSPSTRSLEALQTSVIDSEASNRYETSDIKTPSMRDDVSYASSASEKQGGESSRFRMIGIAVLAVVLVIVLFWIRGQCSKDRPQTKPAIESVKPEEKPAAQKPEEKSAEQKPEEKPAAQNPAAKPASPETTYTVVAGDALSRIAAKTGVSAAEIQKANPGVNFNKIRPGQVIKIPAK